MVIILSGDNTRIVYELQAHLIFLYGLPATMAPKTILNFSLCLQQYYLLKDFPTIARILLI